MFVDTSTSDLTSPLLSRGGLDLPDNLTFEQWAAIGSTLKNAQQSLMWDLGDWLLYGQNKKWGEKYDRAVEATGYDYGTLRNAKSVAKRFPLSRRRDKLTFAHHQEVASLADKDAERLLDEAEAEHLSRNDLRVRVAQIKAAAKVRTNISNSVLVDSAGRPLLDQIICGDALTVLRMLPDEVVNTCVTSPPYFGLRDYGVAGQIGRENTPVLYVKCLVEVFREVGRVLHDGGTLWLNIADSYASDRDLRMDAGAEVPNGSGFIYPGTRIKHKDLIGIPWMLAAALRDDGWYWRDIIVWHKPNPLPESANDRCTKSHEYIFLLSKSPQYHFDHDAIREPAVTPASSKLRGGQAFRTPGGKASVTYGNAPDTWMPDGKRNKRNVWTVPIQPFKDAHVAPMPSELVRPCIQAGSAKGGLVLDPFMGAGTTGLVSKQEGRFYIGIELNPTYVAIAENRISDWTLEN